MTSLLAEAATSRYLIAGIFIVMGLLHFVKAGAFVKVMPDYIPWHKTMVYISGLAELAGGLGMLFPAYRVAASVGLIILLFAVFPANIDMAEKAWQNRGRSWYTTILFLRLPLQFILMYWIYWAGIKTVS